MFCKLHKFLKKASVMESLFCRTVSSHPCNCTKEITITGVFFIVPFQLNLHFISSLFCLKAYSRVKKQFLTIEGPLKMKKSLFHVKYSFCSWLFGYVEKRLDKKAIVNFKIYGTTDWKTNNYNTHITQYVKTIRQWNLVS